MNTDTVPFWLLAAWPMLIAALMRLDRRHGQLPLFVCYAYIAGLAINHFFGGLMYAFPLQSATLASYTMDGFALTTWGLLFFVAGSAVFPGIRRRGSQIKRPPEPGGSARNRRAVNILVIMGLFCWALDFTPIGGVPSLGAAITGGKQMLIGAVCLKCWIAWTEGEKRKLLFWLLVAVVFPLYTTLVMGFLGYGITFLSSILIFVGTFYRPRWRVVIFGVLAIYGGLSLYVGYATDRDTIRDAVWGGKSLAARFSAVEKMMEDVEPFDLSDPKHRTFVDGRLNQNWLVGASMEYVPGFRRYAYGGTLYEALIGLVPRAVWPDKPVRAGSGTLASDFTGIEFATGTSVGIGQVMEFYVNFGWIGVAVGFFIFGAFLRFIDLRIATSILDRDWSTAGLWFAVGLSSLQPIGQLFEITSSMAAAAAFGIVALKLSQTSKRRQPRSVAAAAGIRAGRPAPRSVPARLDRLT